MHKNFKKDFISTKQISKCSNKDTFIGYKMNKVRKIHRRETAYIRILTPMSRKRFPLNIGRGVSNHILPERVSTYNLNLKRFILRP